MKSTILFLSLLITLFSCDTGKKSLTPKEKEKQRAKEELSDYSEKIVLLSTIKKISYDSLNDILTDYYSINPDNNNSDSSRFYSERAISFISEKYKISKRKIASFIFSFKYEMLTKDEIIEIESDQQHEQEDQDRY